jgi:hypothetical protein
MDPKSIASAIPPRPHNFFEVGIVRRFQQADRRLESRWRRMNVPLTDCNRTATGEDPKPGQKIAAGVFDEQHPQLQARLSSPTRHGRHFPHRFLTGAKEILEHICDSQGQLAWFPVYPDVQVFLVCPCLNINAFEGSRPMDRRPQICQFHALHIRQGYFQSRAFLQHF